MPGPLRSVRRRRGPSAAAGALLGGLVGVALLAAFSLPLVFARGPATPVSAPAKAVRAEPVAAPQPPSDRRAEIPAAVPDAAAPPPSPVEAAARPPASLDLPALQEMAAEIDPEPAYAPPPKPAQRKPLPPKRPPASVARAAP
ncbi:hypothetical protein [Methylobacterium durans]|uniref:Uncharacterized protein n=1 Tax=Methylobacterium durans TaxID=2202825 RepID=A0A2U8WCP9_9HYPH|nr:hypothetical protein [Methylobacterium durans]AWN43935.1 hypothetical protein DK389_29770 [Methylobacterium durans]